MFHGAEVCRLCGPTSVHVFRRELTMASAPLVASMVIVGVINSLIWWEGYCEARRGWGGGHTNTRMGKRRVHTHFGSMPYVNCDMTKPGHVVCEYTP